MVTQSAMDERGETWRACTGSETSDTLALFAQIEMVYRRPRTTSGTQCCLNCALDSKFSLGRTQNKRVTRSSVVTCSYLGSVSRVGTELRVWRAGRIVGLFRLCWGMPHHVHRRVEEWVSEASAATPARSKRPLVEEADAQTEHEVSHHQGGGGAQGLRQHIGQIWEVSRFRILKLQIPLLESGSGLRTLWSALDRGPCRSEPGAGEGTSGVCR
jgi:hypothetical protein